MAPPVLTRLTGSTASWAESAERTELMADRRRSGWAKEERFIIKNASFDTQANCRLDKNDKVGATVPKHFSRFFPRQLV
jgi:hypothetical protein